LVLPLAAPQASNNPQVLSVFDFSSPVTLCTYAYYCIEAPSPEQTCGTQWADWPWVYVPIGAASVWRSPPTDATEEPSRRDGGDC
jgi:hypothetical protein